MPYTNAVGSVCGTCEWFASPEDDTDPDGDYIRAAEGLGGGR
jgi:hypothetical protein